LYAFVELLQEKMRGWKKGVARIPNQVYTITSLLCRNEYPEKWIQVGVKNDIHKNKHVLHEFLVVLVW